jgi:hypothetical protein
MDFEKIKFGQNVTSEGWKLARIKDFDTWESKKDATKSGIKAIVRLVNDDYRKDIALLEDEMLLPGGPISKLIEAARNKPINYEQEKPAKLFFEAMGQQVYVLIKHNNVDGKIFPKISQIASIQEFQNLQVSQSSTPVETTTNVKSNEDADWNEIPRT